MNPYKTKKFAALKKTWYGKLKKSGFEDAEGENNALTNWHGQIFMADCKVDSGDILPTQESRHAVVRTFWQAKEIYYRIAGQFLHEHQFKNWVEKKIWELHSKGVPVREIVRELRSRKQNTYKDKVQTTITKLRKEMKDSE